MDFNYFKENSVSEKEIVDVTKKDNSFDPEKRLTCTGDKADKYVMGPIKEFDPDVRLKLENNSSETPKHIERGNELTTEQKNDLISKGMSPGIIGDCTYKDGVYQLKTIYNKFEGRTLGDSGIEYVRKTIDYFGTKLEGVFPKFNPVFTAHLPKEKLLSSDKAQFSECVSQLQKSLESDPSLSSLFTKRQLDQIANGKTPGGFVWHHNEEVGKMELVKFDKHDEAKHTGGRAIWGGGGTAR